MPWVRSHKWPQVGRSRVAPSGKEGSGEKEAPRMGAGVGAKQARHRGKPEVLPFQNLIQ